MDDRVESWGTRGGAVGVVLRVIPPPATLSGGLPLGAEGMTCRCRGYGCCLCFFLFFFPPLLAANQTWKLGAVGSEGATNGAPDDRIQGVLLWWPLKGGGRRRWKEGLLTRVG